MTIKRIVIIVLLLIIVSTLIDYLILSLDSEARIYPHIVGSSSIISHLLTYSLLIIYFRYSKDNFSLTNSADRAKPSIILYLIVLLALGQQLFDLPFFEWKNLANTYLGTTFSLTDYSNYQFESIQLYRVIDALILAPFLEEIIFRYYIFGGLLKNYSMRTAMLTSSILFSLIHIDSPRNLIPTFVFGIISSILYFRTHKICYSILLHLFANSLWVATVVFAKEYDELKRQIGFGGLFWCIFFMGALALTLGLKKITTANTLQ